ncbi:hemerythrin domain-containing protein [Skermania sp. ID1734]|nr:hemerythrin domain-containing protein [Skermania sp. ID1734]
MVIVHNVFRVNLGALPNLVRNVADGDRRRAEVLVCWLTELLDGLHHHHTGEDELMWPILANRAPADTALVLQMEEQHGRIGSLMAVVREQSTAFADSGSQGAGDDLANSLTELNLVLDEHLRAEEERILPIVETHMTRGEWQALAERGNSAIPKNRRLVFLGYMLYTATPSQRALLMALLPLPIRILWRIAGRRAFAADYRGIYGTAPRW